MRIFRKIVIMSLGALCFAEAADACGTYSSMQPHDYAFAEIIFEGEIKNVFPKYRYNPYSKVDQVVSTELLFSVEKVIRGTFPDTEVLVGFNQHTFGAPGSVTEFNERFGTHVRVGLVTPKQHDTFCRNEMVEFTRGTEEKFQREQTVCDFNYFHLKNAKDIPFVQTAPCANQFILDISKPMAPQIPKIYRSNYRAGLINIFREYSTLFTSNLTDISSEMDYLVEKGIGLYEINKRDYLKTDKERDEFIEFAKDRLRDEFLVLAKLTETDPELRERFLREELSNIDE